MEHYSVRLVRTVEEFTDVVILAKDPSDARTKAKKNAESEETDWTKSEGSESFMKAITIEVAEI